jgi:hypothetical protein
MPGNDGREGSLIERFMPTYEVAERHEIRVDAPAEYVFAAAREMDVNRSPLVRAVFAVRTLPSRLHGETPRQSSAPLLAETLALGWRILAETPDREVVVGAVTQPWRAEVEFRGLDPETFADFAEPGYAKIVWTLEAVPQGRATSLFRTETRVSTTDRRSRALFRRYWAVFSPGILLIRRQSLKLVKADAERRCSPAASYRLHAEEGAAGSGRSLQASREFHETFSPSSGRRPTFEFREKAHIQAGRCRVRHVVGGSPAVAARSPGPTSDRR